MTARQRSAVFKPGLVAALLAAFTCAPTRAAETASAINALDMALSAAWRASKQFKVDDGACVSLQIAGWKHFLNDSDEMVLGVRTDCQFSDKPSVRVEAPVRFNMLDVALRMDGDAVVMTCVNMESCMTVEPGGAYPLAGQKVFVWSFKPLQSVYGSDLVAAFAPAQIAHSKLIAENKNIDEQIVAQRSAVGVAMAASNKRR